MNDINVHRELDEHRDAVSNFSEHLTGLATRLTDVGGFVPAGRLLVLQILVNLHNTEFMLAMAGVEGPPVDDEEEAPARKPRKTSKPRPPGEHRHVFVNGKCAFKIGDGVLCDKVKGAGGRGNKRETPEQRTAELPAIAKAAPAPMGDAMADRFAGGGHGSSSANERGR